ncbi:RagB/SusD family nutrient uptake outer membrane protein [Solitalea lacus]|uniref:RagB/SusD family nutrient uptake outer membrane protein n=1 Tax=Solitalea lacus TaxID=2911172 RepID=UPI001EDA481B|nr:RagB/SusD family nutrient uptake outer membrane protein [Solitalea lacus]UKJ07648.1 RagB/SusD family nutrient uptake outer membrane protein [Solitalea lacus]
MKSLYKNTVCLSLVALLATSACDKKLDLRPENNLTEAALLENKVTTERLLIGGYYEQFLVERSVINLADMSTGIATGTLNNYYTGSIDSKNDEAFNIWSAHYKIINIADVVINRLPSIGKYDESAKKQFIAEAKFLRAFSYFRLITLYGDDAFGINGANKLGVPLRLDAFERYDESQLLPRSANKEVLDRVVKDLEEALPDLPTTTANIDLHARATKSVGKAFLSRVYLYLGQYNKAIQVADDVLADPTFVLAASPATIFPNNSSVVQTNNAPLNIKFDKEVVYGYPVSWNAYLNSSTTHKTFTGTGTTFIDPQFVASFAATDIRKSAMITIKAVSGINRFITSKYTHPSLYDNLMVIRLAEVILNKAEALAKRDGNVQSAVDMLNLIHQRAFPAGNKPVPFTTTSFTDGADLVKAILQERKWELAFEGHDRFDRLRNNMPINAEIPANKNVFPIPQKEIDISMGLIKQNPGYVQ